MSCPKNEPSPNLADIQLLVLDVDGVLTDGNIIITEQGRESKSFNTQDGHGIRLWRRAGLKVALLSGRASDATSKRAQQLEIDYVFQACFDKMSVLTRLCEQLKLSAQNIAYVGDDLMDIAPIKYAGFGVAVANAVQQVKQVADYITDCRGGRGAVREVIEYILKSSGRWERVVQKYFEDGISSGC